MTPSPQKIKSPDTPGRFKATVTREIPEDDPVEGPRLTAHIDRMARKYLGVERYELRDPGREEQRILFELRVDRVATFGRP